MTLNNNGFSINANYQIINGAEKIVIFYIVCSAIGHLSVVLKYFFISHKPITGFGFIT